MFWKKKKEAPKPKPTPAEIKAKAKVKTSELDRYIKRINELQANAVKKAVDLKSQGASKTRIATTLKTIVNYRKQVEKLERTKDFIERLVDQIDTIEINKSIIDITKGVTSFVQDIATEDVISKDDLDELVKAQSVLEERQQKMDDMMNSIDDVMNSASSFEISEEEKEIDRKITEAVTDAQLTSGNKEEISDEAFNRLLKEFGIS